MQAIGECRTNLYDLRQQEFGAGFGEHEDCDICRRCRHYPWNHAGEPRENAAHEQVRRQAIGAVRYLLYMFARARPPGNAGGGGVLAPTRNTTRRGGGGGGNRRIFYEFSNRGNRGLMGFNYGRGTDMSTPEYAGDGFLMRQGYTLVWSGWQGDLIDRGNNVVAYLPFALQDGKPLRGRVRQEFNPMEEGLLSIGTSAGAEGGVNVQPYPVVDRATA